MLRYDKPLPEITPESKGFWEGCRRHELLIQKCRVCGALRHYPRAMCPNCGSWEIEWVKVSGRGKVYSWMVTHRTFHHGFAGDVPYASVIVELEEGVRLMTEVVDVKSEELYIGMPVEVVFEDVTPEITLPKFKKAA